MQSKPGSLAILCYSLFTAVTAFVPQAPVAPSPQYARIRLGAYRFINYATNTALSIEDSNVDSAVVLMPVKADDDAQIWQVIDISSNIGASFVNNRTGGFYNRDTYTSMNIARVDSAPGVPVVQAESQPQGSDPGQTWIAEYLGT
ncbi:MAG: hypothetical protein L6R35_000664 [Caloplaca aegaea]|nr:MAG: hypothetical protein L6R35_000664 [Caloplaca aegaea]